MIDIHVRLATRRKAPPTANSDDTARKDIDLAELKGQGRLRHHDASSITGVSTVTTELSYFLSTHPSISTDVKS